MNVVALRTLHQFWSAHADAEQPLREWHKIAVKARWKSPQDIKNQFGGNVDFVADNRVVFDIKGNKYRLIAFIAYGAGAIFVKFIGTHAEYDKINAETVDEH